MSSPFSIPSFLSLLKLYISAITFSTWNGLFTEMPNILPCLMQHLHIFCFCLISCNFRIYCSFNAIYPEGHNNCNEEQFYFSNAKLKGAVLAIVWTLSHVLPDWFYLGIQHEKKHWLFVGGQKVMAPVIKYSWTRGFTLEELPCSQRITIILPSHEQYITVRATFYRILGQTTKCGFNKGTWWHDASLYLIYISTG